MNVSYSDATKQWQNGYFELLQQATMLLEGIVGESANRVSAEWDCVKDARGRLILSLTIRDATGQATAHFTPDELSVNREMRYRLLDLWGDLLQVRSHRLLEKLTEASG